MGRANISGDVAVAPDCDPSIMGTTTSTYISGVMTGCIMPATIGTTSAVGSPVRPVIGSGIVAITGCSAISEGDP